MKGIIAMADRQETKTDGQEVSEVKTPEEKKKKVLKEILSWIVTIAAAVAIALVIRQFVFEPVRVDGKSMLTTLNHGEIMFTTKPEYLLGDPQRGDVIICHYPDRSENFVKRIIGLPGETVRVEGTQVYINGELLEEPYLDPAQNTRGHSCSEIMLADNEYFVCGDNRDNSNDSRYVGPITRGMIRGHVRAVIFPFNKVRGIQ